MEHICEFCGKVFDRKGTLGLHRIYCSENPDRITPWNKGLTADTDARVKARGERLKERYRTRQIKPSNLGRKHTEEEKKNLSIKRKKYIEEHPDKVPYLLNHSSKKSYPETYFDDLFQKEGIDLKYHKQVGIYELDFYNDEKAIDVEIDGSQHFATKKNIERDERRTIFLNGRGWKVYRIEWSKWCSLNYGEKHEIIKEIKLLLEKDVEPERKILTEKLTWKKKESIKEETLNERIAKIKESNIDFTHMGWVQEVANLVRCSKKTAKNLVREQLPEIYNTAWKYDVTRKKNSEYIERVLQNKLKREKEISDKITLIHNSGIDFGKRGWVKKLSEILNTEHYNIIKFMKRYDLEFYNQCYHTK
jgi:very-short-patch-repair endonuclease